MTFKASKGKRQQKKPDSPAQAAVKLYGQRLFAQGSTGSLISHLKQLGCYTEAYAVERAIGILKVEATKEYEKERLRLDPRFETATMRYQRLWQESIDSFEKATEERKE